MPHWLACSSPQLINVIKIQKPHAEKYALSFGMWLCSDVRCFEMLITLVNLHTKKIFIHIYE